MDLKDALTFLGQQAVEAAAIRTHQPDAEPSYVYLTRDKDGGLHFNEAKPKPRDHKAADLSAIIAFAKQFPAAQVFYGRDGVTALLDENRRDRVVLELPSSPQLATLLRWEEGQGGSWSGVSQSELIHTLRTTFKRCMGPCPLLLESLRRLKFEAGSTTTTEIRSAKQSLSRDQLARVSGEADIVEEFNLAFPIFDGCLPSIQGGVTIALDTDPAKATFRLTPIPGDIEAAIRDAESTIGKMLRDAIDGDRIYYGSAK